MGGDNHSKPQSPVTEPNTCHEPVAKKKGKGGDSKRVHVRVISHRRRLCDADNLFVKYFVDCIKYAKIIEDDSAKHIMLEVSQEKSKDEQTIIEISEL